MTKKCLPVGAIVPFAGKQSNLSLNQQGWHVCDGTTFSQDILPSLYTAIGNCNGFVSGLPCYPNLQGVFLRGYDSTGKIDVDVETRIPQISGGNSGNNVATLQHYSTKPPQNTFSFNYPTAPGPNDGMWATHFSSASDVPVLRYSPPSPFYGVYSGGDKESRPGNIYVNYILRMTNDEDELEKYKESFIKSEHKEIASSNSVLRTGIIVPYCGSQSQPNAILSANYLKCDGSPVTQHSGSVFATLVEAIGTMYGGDGVSLIKVPNYSNLFLRGADNGTGIDPDAINRTSANKNCTSNISKLGSTQSFATGLPKRPFQCTGSYPQCDFVGTGNGLGNVNIHPQNQDIQTAINITNTGGDPETRPKNARIEYYILAQENQDTLFPIGGLIAFAGENFPDPEDWLLCDGKEHSATDYPELSSILGTTWGVASESTSFLVPNLAGQFLRNVDYQNPEIKIGQFESDMTGTPTNPIVLNSRCDINVEAYNTGSYMFKSSPIFTWVPGTQTSLVENGDEETRPINVCVNFYIKAKHS